MDVFTLYVGQGALAGVRSGPEAVLVDSYMPDAEDVTKEQVEATLRDYLKGRNLRGLILTGLDADHAHAEGVDSILTNHDPEWVMYPKCYKDTDCASSVFDVITRHEKRRTDTSRPLVRHSVRLDRLETRRLSGLALGIDFELFSPHIEDMDNSNNSSIVVKVTGVGPAGFRYLVTGDTETERWERISELFGEHLRSEVMAAPHHGSKTGVHVPTVLHTNPNTVLISAGVDNQYGHPDGAAVAVYSKLAKHIWATNSSRGGHCLFTQRSGNDFDTRLVSHSAVTPA